MARQRDHVLAVLFALLAYSPKHAAAQSEAPLTPPREDARLPEPEVKPRGRHEAREIPIRSGASFASRLRARKPYAVPASLGRGTRDRWPFAST
jgi:hypothetical protein